MIALNEFQQGAGKVEFPLAIWEGTKVQPKPAATLPDQDAAVARKLTSLALDFWRDLQPHFALWAYYCGLF